MRSVWNWGKGAHWAQGERDSRFSRRCLKRDIERESFQGREVGFRLTHVDISDIVEIDGRIQGFEKAAA